MYEHSFTSGYMKKAIGLAFCCAAILKQTFKSQNKLGSA